MTFSTNTIPLIKPKDNFFKNWRDSHPGLDLWLKRISLYGLVFLILFLILTFGFKNIILTWSDLENARSFFSTIIPCQAGIIAIVISLTLITVQINATSYSSRLVSYVIKKNPDFWILLIVYLCSIILGSYALLSLTNENVQYFLFWIVLLAIFTFTALFPYFIRALDLVKSDFILSELVDELSKDAILRNDSSFMLIFDVLKSSISRSDVLTVQYGLFPLQKKVAQIVLKSDDDQKKQVNELYCKYLTITGLTAIDKKNEELSREVNSSLCNYAFFCLEQGDLYGVSKCSSSIYIMSLTAIKQNLGTVSLLGITHLLDLTKKLIEQDNEDLTKIIIEVYFRDLGGSAISTVPNGIIPQICEGYADICCSLLIRKKQTPLLGNSIVLLFSLVFQSISKITSDEVCEIFNHSNLLAQKLAEDLKDYELSLLITSYGLSSTYLSIQPQKELFWHIIENLKNISSVIIQKDLTLSQNALVECSLIISKNCVSIFPINHLDTLISIISEVCQNNAEKKREDNVCRTLFVLKELYLVSLNNQMLNEAQLVLDSIYEISKKCISNEINLPLIASCGILTSATHVAIKKNYVGLPSKISKDLYEDILEKENLKEFDTFKDIPSTALSIFQDIEIYSIKNNSEKLWTVNIYSIGNIAVVAGECGKSEIVEKILQMLLKFGKDTLEKNVVRSMLPIISDLGDIGEITQKKKFKGLFTKSVLLLITFGVISSHKKDNQSIKLAVDILSNFSDLEPDVVNSVLKKYKSIDPKIIKLDFDEFYQEYRQNIERKQNVPKEFEDYLDMD
ncbi:MAG: hypothetical protein WC367_02115 [Methanoregula sp.]|jgi:hypothetical protein